MKYFEKLWENSYASEDPLCSNVHSTVVPKNICVVLTLKYWLTVQKFTVKKLKNVRGIQ
mgnify:FL=1